MGLLYVAPVLLILFGRGLTSLLTAAAWLVMAITFHRHFGGMAGLLLRGIGLQGVAVFYLGANVVSAFRLHMGRGEGWKNRT